MNGTRRLRHLVSLVALGLITAAPTCDQSYNESTGSMTGAYPCDGSGNCKWQGYGDSIMAGNLNSGTGTLSDDGRRGSYFRYFADQAAAEMGWAITYDADAVAGEVTTGIRGLMATSEIQAAHFVTVSAGGNDFLSARSDYKSSCNVAALDAALAAWRSDFDAITQKLQSDLLPGTMVQYMNIYYPDPHNDWGVGCGAFTDFEVFLPRLLAAADYTCFSAESNGWRCADSLAAINCVEDVEGNPDFACPNKRWLQEIVADGSCARAPSGNLYDTLDPDCITTELDLRNGWEAIQNTHAVDKAGTLYDLIQGDETHPTLDGHREIGFQHHALGYNGFSRSSAGTYYASSSYEGTYAMCIDSQDNDNDSATDCDDADCAAFCETAPPGCAVDADCDDGDVCNGAETCDGGSCSAGTALSCDDSNACTTDSCDPASGCSNTTISCDDGDACNGAETCDPASGCQAGSPVSCDDGDACTADTCDPATGSCSNDAVSCDDGDVCNGAESCDPASGCQAGSPLSCDDGNACTADSCDAGSGCSNTTISCDDGDACTADSCDPVSGCVNEPIEGCGACTPSGDSCSSHSDCCGGLRCKGKGGSKTCQ